MKIKRIFFFGYALGFMLFLSSCGIGSKATKTQLAQGEKTIEILAVNDMHAAIDNFPRLGFIVDSLRAIYPNLLLVSGGDNQTGNPVNDQYPEKGWPIIKLMNALDFELSAVGNHEYDSKPDGFSNLLHKANFDFIGANSIPANKSAFPIKPYKIIRLPNGVDISIVSVLDINEGGIPDTHPDHVKDFEFPDPFETALQYLFLKDSSDVLVYLNHFGFENDVELANKFPKGVVDLIIGGHSHTLVETEQLHNDILITQAGSKLGHASLIKMSLLKDGSLTRNMELIPVGKHGKEAIRIREIVDRLNDNPSLNEVLAQGEADFTSREKVGYLMVDALRHGANADIALINPGGVRINELSKGDIRVKDVYLMDPFGNEITLFNLSGHEIKAMLINAFRIDYFNPIIPSGIKLTYHIAEDNSVKDIEFFHEDDSPMDMDKSYLVAMNSYMPTVYVYEHEDVGKSLSVRTADNMIDYLKNKKSIPSYKNQKRIKLIK